MSLFRVNTVALAAACLAATALSLPVLAAENGLQRYSPGIGGSDMTSPLVPGWYFQMPVVKYHASKLQGNDGRQATVDSSAASPGSRTSVKATADNIGLLPRLTYLSPTQVLGANVGWTVQLPLAKRRATFDGVNTYLANGMTIAAPSPVKSRIASQNGSEFGLSDAEVSPVFHWEIGDHQAVTVAPTVVLPTGDYNVAQRVNPGYGNYFTFRPSAQYAFIGDGWDVGVRAVYSVNTRNKANGYLSGKMFNLDYQVMAFVSEDVRLGVQGYFVRQLSADTQNLDGFSSTQVAAYSKEIIDGNKMSVNAAGPALAWLKNGGEMLIEGKLLREYSARNRFEGSAFWLTVSKPL